MFTINQILKYKHKLLAKTSTPIIGSYDSKVFLEVQSTRLLIDTQDIDKLVEALLEVKNRLENKIS